MPGSEDKETVEKCDSGTATSITSNAKARPVMTTQKNADSSSLGSLADHKRSDSSKSTFALVAGESFRSLSPAELVSKLLLLHSSFLRRILSYTAE